MHLIDETGNRFGKLLVLGRATHADRKKVRWECRCDCGRIVIRLAGSLRVGKGWSCGCQPTRVARKHGLRSNRVYSIWQGMKARCYNPKHKAFPDYGERGIKVCERWRRSAADFVSDMGHPPDGYSIERKDVNGDYCPENCCWIPVSEQWRNRRDPHFVAFKGEKKRVGEWAEAFGISKNTLRTRMYRFGIEVAFVLSEYFGIRRIAGFWKGHEWQEPNEGEFRPAASGGGDPEGAGAGVTGRLGRGRKGRG